MWPMAARIRSIVDRRHGQFVVDRAAIVGRFDIQPRGLVSVRPHSRAVVLPEENSEQQGKLEVVHVSAIKSNT